MKTRLVDRIILPRKDNCCDWGSVRFVLARQGAKELLWWTARKTWVGRMEGYQPAPAELLLRQPSEHFSSGLGKSRTLHEGGRLSRALLLEHAQAIDAFFGQEVTPLLDPKKTLLLEG